MDSFAHNFESPDALAAGARCALRASGPAVLASPAFRQRVAPFSLTRIGWLASF